MPAIERAYYELGKIAMEQKIIKATKDSSLLYTDDLSRLMGITDAWNVVYDVIDKETEDT